MKYIFFLLFVFSFYSVNSTLNKTNVNGLECSVCNLGISFIENYLQNNHTETELENVLDNLCNKTHYTLECTSLVNNYLPQVILLIEEKETLAEICHQLNLCDSYNYYNISHLH